MKKQQKTIGNVPAVIWGAQSDKVLLFVHGQGGSKEEAAMFSEIVCRQGWQVLSIDLPEHGERKEETNRFYPWVCVPELKQVMDDIKKVWKSAALYANSIGAWFSMLAFGTEPLAQCLFVSPIVDMENLICNMMQWSNVTKQELAEKREIAMNFGETLSWEYLCYVRKHPIIWNVPTCILYGEHDNLTSIETVSAFAKLHHADLTVIPGGEHWFHTDEQMQFLDKWIRERSLNDVCG